MQLDPNEIYEKLVTLGTEWAEAKYAADLLDKATKPLIAKLAADSNESSQSAKEAFAHRHSDYKEHCKILAKAEKDEAIARVKYHSAITWSELIRTVAANERAANRSAT